MVMDFAEKRKALYCAEVKSAHFGKSQITLHPIVVYWKDQQAQLVRHVLMYLPDDTKHDYHAVQHFTTHSIEYVKQLTCRKRLIIFSVGCAFQYKGKGTFADLSLMQGFEVEMVYYSSEHGKGEADGETGILSQQLRRAVLGGHINVRHANDLHAWAVANMARKIFLVENNNHNRSETGVGTLMGTRKYHQVWNVTVKVLRKLIYPVIISQI